MTETNGWPGKPGVPLNPERDGWHWLRTPDENDAPYEWRGSGECERGRWPAYWVSLDADDWQPAECTYIAPVLTPAEVDARIVTARKDAREEAARRLEELHRQHKYNPETGEGSEHDTGYYRALVEGAAWIRALSDTPTGMVLVPREPTSAMIQACLQAALDFMAETKTTEVHPGQTYPNPSENARRCWRAMVKAAGKGEGEGEGDE